jgi:energy-coupling factor transporter transmembrane protein EcfT
MRRSWLDVWGSAAGPVTRLAPQARILAGASMFAACLVPRPATALGSLLVAGTVVAWIVLCRPPARLVGAALIFSLALFSLAFVIAPLAPAWAVLARGVGTVLVSVATIATLGITDLDDGLAGLPLPRPVTALVTQIVHQTGTLAGETRRIVQAMAVRGAVGNARAGVSLLGALPRVWLPRIVLRAERVAAVMELRGFGPETAAVRRISMTTTDIVCVLSAALWLGLTLALRYKGVS